MFLVFFFGGGVTHVMKVIKSPVINSDIDVFFCVFLSSPRAVQFPDVDLIFYECCMKLFWEAQNAYSLC